MRLAPGQDPDTIATAFEQLISAAAPDGAELKLERWSSARPGIVPPDARAIQLGQDAFERVLGVRPALEHSNVELLTGAYVDRLETDPSGRL